MTLKKQSISSIQDRFIYKVKKNLIDSNPSKYLTTGVDGRFVEKKLEHICKGKVPAVHDIQGLLASTDINPRVAEKGKTTVRNPYRKLWSDRGMQWPSTCTSSTCTSTSVTSSYTTELSDDYYLALGIQESLKSAPDLYAETKEVLYAETKEVTEVTTHEAETGEKDHFEGLNVLLEACNELQDQ